METSVSRGRMRKKLEEKSERREQGRQTLLTGIHNLAASLKTIRANMQSVSLLREVVKKPLTSDAAVGDLVQRLTSASQAMDNIGAVVRAPLLPPASTIKEEKSPLTLTEDARSPEKILNGLARNMAYFREELSEIQTEVLNSIAQSYDKDDSLSAEESALKKTICLKISCALKLRAHIFVASSRSGEIHQSENANLKKLFYSLLSYLPAEEFLSSLFAENMSVLYKPYQAQRSDVATVIQKFFPKLQDFEKTELVQLVQETRSKVIEYSDSYFELEDSIKELCLKHPASSQSYSAWQASIMREYLEKLMSHPQCHANANLRAFAKIEREFMLKVLSTPAYKMKGDIQFAKSLDFDLSEEEFEGLVRPYQPKSKEQKREQTFTQAELSQLVQRKIVELTGQEFEPLLPSNEDPAQAQLLAPTDLPPPSQINAPDRTESTRSDDESSQGVNLNPPGSKYLAPQLRAGYVPSAIANQLSPHIELSQFSSQNEIKSNEMQAETARLDRLKSYLSFHSELLSESKQKTLVRKMQIRALMFEMMQYMEQQAERNSHFSRGIDQHLARGIRTALVHAEGVINPKLLDEGVVNTLHQEIMALSQDLVRFIEDEKYYDELAKNPLFVKLRKHAKDLSANKEIKPAPIHYGLSMRSEALSYLKCSSDDSLSPDLRQMALPALRMANILGDVYAPGFGFDHQAAVLDRHAVANQVKSESLKNGELKLRWQRL